MKILQINSSIRGLNSESTRVANNLVSHLKSSSSVSKIIVRDLSSNPHPALDSFAIDSIHTAENNRTIEQQSRVDLDDALIEEVISADIIVIAAPMYNFGIPTQLKSWIDAIARSGVTFQYTENGPVGLLKNKAVFIVTSRGGSYEQDSDPVIGPVKKFLEFLGINKIQVIISENQGLGIDQATIGREKANMAILNTKL